MPFVPKLQTIFVKSSVPVGLKLLSGPLKGFVSCNRQWINCDGIYMIMLKFIWILSVKDWIM
jgi:hypothetical protein